MQNREARFDEQSGLVSFAFQSILLSLCEDESTREVEVDAAAV